MRLTFMGAAGEVTGSCLLVETSHVRFIVDCGMFQGGREAPRRNRDAYARDLGLLDFALLTHAHIDHCGLLPRFAQRDRLLIYCTKPTADLVPVMLRDSAHVQTRASKRPWREPAEALYDADDVERLATQLIGVPYDVEFRPHPDVPRLRRVRLGSALRARLGAGWKRLRDRRSLRGARVRRVLRCKKNRPAPMRRRAIR